MSDLEDFGRQEDQKTAAKRIEDLLAECDRLKAERDRLKAEVAQMRQSEKLYNCCTLNAAENAQLRADLASMTARRDLLDATLGKAVKQLAAHAARWEGLKTYLAALPSYMDSPNDAGRIAMSHTVIICAGVLDKMRALQAAVNAITERVCALRDRVEV